MQNNGNKSGCPIRFSWEQTRKFHLKRSCWNQPFEGKCSLKLAAIARENRSGPKRKLIFQSICFREGIFHISWNILLGARYWALGFPWLGYFNVFHSPDTASKDGNLPPGPQVFQNFFLSFFPTPTQSIYLPQNYIIPTCPWYIFPIARSNLYFPCHPNRFFPDELSITSSSLW